MLFSIKDLEFSYEHGESVDSNWRLVVDNFDVAAGQLYVLSGDNMSGKSTFLALIGGLLPFPRNGKISLNGDSIGQSEIARVSVMLSSDDEMFPELTVLDNIMVALPELTFRARAKVVAGVSKLFDQSGVLSKEDCLRPLGDLSSGGRALAKLGRAYISTRPIVVVDEISSFLDQDRASYFLDTLVDFVQSGRSVVIVSHNDRDRNYLSQKVDVISYHLSRTEKVTTLGRRQS